MYQLVRLAQLIGLNALPGFGFLALRWTGGTVLALYWIENLLGSFLVAARIDLHRRLTHKRGHYVPQKATTVVIGSGPQKKTVSTMLNGFMWIAFVFTLAEGVFLGVLIANLPESEAIDFNSLRYGVCIVAALLVVGIVATALQGRSNDRGVPSPAVRMRYGFRRSVRSRPRSTADSSSTQSTVSVGSITSPC